MKSIPHICILFNAVVWGLIWIPMQWLNNQGLSVILTTFFSYLLLSGLLIAIKPSSILKVFQSKTLILMAIAYGLTNICFNWAVTNGDVVRVVFLFYLMPIWAAIFAKLVLSENIGIKGLVRILLAVLGLLIVLDIFDQLSFVFDINFYEVLAILGGIFFGFANVLLRKSKTSSSFNRSIAIFLGSCLVPFFILIISFFLIGYESFANAIENLKNINNSGFTIVFVVVIMALALGTANFFLQYGGSKLLVKTTSLLMVIEIPVAIFSSALLTNKTTELSVFIGGGLIVLTAIWASFDQRYDK